MDSGSEFQPIKVGRDGRVAHFSAIRSGVQAAHITASQQAERQELGAGHSPRRPTCRCTDRQMCKRIWVWAASGSSLEVTAACRARNRNWNERRRKLRFPGALLLFTPHIKHILTLKKKVNGCLTPITMAGDWRN